jgi:hypothetical protein
MAELTKEEKIAIAKEVRELIDKGLVKPDFEGLTDEQAVKVIMTQVNYDEVEARFILAMQRGELPFEDGDIKIVY